MSPVAVLNAQLIRSMYGPGRPHFDRREQSRPFLNFKDVIHLRIWLFGGEGYLSGVMGKKSGVCAKERRSNAAY